MSRRSFGKYGVASRERRTLDGIVFDSRSEMLRWIELQLLERAGEITHLRRQPAYPIVINGVHVCEYIGDFAYCKNGVEVIEDVKGVAMPVFGIKAKLMRAVWGIEVRVTGAGGKRIPTKIRLPSGRHRPGVLGAR